MPVLEGFRYITESDVWFSFVGVNITAMIGNCLDCWGKVAGAAAHPTSSLLNESNESCLPHTSRHIPLQTVKDNE